MPTKDSRKLVGDCMPKNIKCLVDKNGDSVQAILDEHQTSIDELKAWKEDPCATADPCAEVSSGDSITSTTQSSSAPVTRQIQIDSPITYGTKASDSSVEVHYNVAPAIASIGCDKCFSNVSISNGSTTLGNQSTETGVFTVKPSDLPVTLRVQGTCVKDGQEVKIDFEKIIRDATSDKEEFISGQTIQTGGFSSSDDRMDFLQECIDDIKYRLRTQESVESNGIQGIDSIIADQNAKLADLTATLDGIDTTCDGVSICDINTALQSLQADMTAIQSELSSLRTLYNKLDTIIAGSS